MKAGSVVLDYSKIIFRDATLLTVQGTQLELQLCYYVFKLVIRLAPATYRRTRFQSCNRLASL